MFKFTTLAAVLVLFATGCTWEAQSAPVEPVAVVQSAPVVAPDVSVKAPLLEAVRVIPAPVAVPVPAPAPFVSVVPAEPIAPAEYAVDAPEWVEPAPVAVKAPAVALEAVEAPVEPVAVPTAPEVPEEPYEPTAEEWGMVVASDGAWVSPEYLAEYEESIIHIAWCNANGREVDEFGDCHDTAGTPEPPVPGSPVTEADEQ